MSKVGFDGKFAEGTRVVDDPYEPGASIVVPFNMLHDPLSRMYARKEIDLGQYQAGQYFCALIEAAGGAGAPAVDYSQPAVDRSFKHKNPALTQLDAARELRVASIVLGWETYRLVRALVFDGLNGTMIAQANPQHDRKAVTKQVRQGLEKLGILWRFLSGPEHMRKRAAIVGWLQQVAVWSHDETEVEIVYADRS